MGHSYAGAIAMYAIKFNIDTWLKSSTAQGSQLSDDERYFVDADSVFPLTYYESVEGNHVRILFGRDAQGQQISPGDRIEWYVYEPATEIFRVPVVDAYTLEVNVDTWLKQAPVQSSQLSANEKQLIQAKTVLPIIGFLIERDHVKVTFGKNTDGQQIQFLGRNTWYIYKPHADILLNGIPIYGYTVKFKTDTWLKQTMGQVIDLPDDDKQFIPERTVLPVTSFSIQGIHLKVTLGKDSNRNQLQFKGKNTWHVFSPHVSVLHNGKPYSLELTTNEKGLRLIKSFEGLRLTAYQDAVGIWTIGYGTTTNVYPGMRISLQKAEALLRDDLRRFEAAVNQLVTRSLNADQFSALVALTYNIGENAFASSTLLQKLNSGDRSGAAEEFLKWVFAGGRVLGGLVRRRNAERALFLGEDFVVFINQ
ncbi:MAG: lysozyme [Cyanobacteria bacterium P01_A01_bin.37]